MDSRVALKCRARFTSNSLSSVCKARLPRWQDALDAGPLRDSARRLKRLEETRRDSKRLLFASFFASYLL